MRKKRVAEGGVKPRAAGGRRGVRIVVVAVLVGDAVVVRVGVGAVLKIL